MSGGGFGVSQMVRNREDGWCSNLADFFHQIQERQQKGRNIYIQTVLQRIRGKRDVCNKQRGTLTFFLKIQDQNKKS